MIFGRGLSGLRMGVGDPEIDYERCVGWFVGYLGVLLVMGLVGIKFYRKIKDRQASGFLLHAMYWYGGMGSKESFPTSLPLSFIRRFF